MKAITAFVGKVLVSSLLVSQLSQVMAGTSRMDNEFFAIQPRTIFAVKISGKWIKPIETFTLGLRGNTFSVDARSASKEIPATCSQLFENDMVRFPATKSVSPRGIGKNEFDSQQISFKKSNEPSNTCAIRLWLKSPSSYSAGDFGPNSLPKTPSIVTGIIEFKAGSNVSVIEFAVGADDV